MNHKEINNTFHDLRGIKEPNMDPALHEVIGGQDDRKDVYELANSAEETMQRKLIASTVILTNKSSLSKNESGGWTLDLQDFRQGGRPPCSGERFGHQKIGGWCSGFLVGSDVIVTAGHCGKTEAEIQNTAYVFGFQASSKTDMGSSTFDSNQVYFGRELIAHDLSSEGDFAIVRLDREVNAPDSTPLSLRASGSPVEGGNLGVIGYPSGLPVKVAFGHATKLIKDQGPWLISNLDTYGGNSGSPVFNSNGEVEGILVRGATDYRMKENCFISNRVDDAEGSEVVTKTNVFLSQIP